MIAEVALILGAYLLGSLPVLYWIGRMRGFDLRKEYDMHLSLWRKVGYKEGLAGILWDLFKGSIPPLIAWGLDMSPLVVGISGLAVVAGQMWPVFLAFQNGEKGNSTGIGASFAIAPITMCFAVIPIATAAFIRALPALLEKTTKDTDRFKFSGVSDSMPLGMLIGFGILPMIAWMRGEDTAIVWVFVVLFGMIVFRRLTADITEEMKCGLKTNLASVLLNRFLFDRSYYN